MLPDESDATDQTKPLGARLANRASHPLEQGSFEGASKSDAATPVEKTKKVIATKNAMRWKFGMMTT
jgi:hypothetical protein